MRIVFIDDSQQPDPPRVGLERLLAVGAVSIPGDQVSGYAADLNTIRADLGIPADEELKWAPDRGSFLKNNWGLVAPLRAKMLEAAAERQVKTIVVILDHGVRYRELTSAEAGAEVLLKRLYERVTMHLEDLDEIGLIIADKPGGGATEEKKWLADSLKLTNLGTEYVNPDQVILPIVTADSRYVPHLQLADAAAATTTTAAYAGRPSGLDLVPLLRPLMHRHRLGAVNGAGIVLVPEHMNLYHWAFDETGWSKPSMSGWTLLRAGLDYDDGPGLSA